MSAVRGADGVQRRSVRCRWCTWSTPVVMVRGERTISGFVALRAHVKAHHPIEHGRLLAELRRIGMKLKHLGGGDDPQEDGDGDELEPEEIE